MQLDDLRKRMTCRFPPSIAGGASVGLVELTVTQYEQIIATDESDATQSAEIIMAMIETVGGVKLPRHERVAFYTTVGVKGKMLLEKAWKRLHVASDADSDYFFGEGEDDAPGDEGNGQSPANTPA